MVRADWRPKHRASSMAVCKPGGEEGEARDELGSGGVGRNGAQDGSAHPDHEESGAGSHAVESGGLGPLHRYHPFVLMEKRIGTRWLPAWAHSLARAVSLELQEPRLF